MIKDRNKLKNVDRNKIYFTQTPQAFNYKTLLNLQKKITSNITDDSNLFIKLFISQKKIEYYTG